MDGNFKTYNWMSSSTRIREILDAGAGDFVETDDLPPRDRLTYGNGFYGQCGAVFVDIRGSSGLASQYQRPRLAKIYRAFISEMVAVLNGNKHVREVNIVGDCVWAVYNTPLQSDIDGTFERAYVANTLCELLNRRFAQHDIAPIRIGIGVDWGRVLMIKAGYDGSGINDVVYMGDVVNRAAHLAHKAGRSYEDPIWAGADFYFNLNPHNMDLLHQWHDRELGTVYRGAVVETLMYDWINRNF